MVRRAASALRRYSSNLIPKIGDGPYFDLWYKRSDKRLVRAEGLEPPQLSSLEPKSSASTSSATPAEVHPGPAAMPRAAAYNMSLSVRSKKMALLLPPRNVPHRLDIGQ